MICRRKNIGYLYAVSHAAYAVYDGADSQELLQDYIPVLRCGDAGRETTRNITASPCAGLYTVADAPADSNVFDPWQLFARSPLHTASSNTSSAATQMCFSRQMAAPLIQHSLSNQQDAVVDPTAFSVVLPRNVTAPAIR